MINNVVLVGRLTSDPELKKTKTDLFICNFSIAVNRVYSKNNQVDFINCVAWNQTAKLVSEYLKKGSMVGVQGRIQTNTYKTNTGENRRTFEIHCDRVQFLERKRNNEPSDDVKKELVDLDKDLSSTTQEITDEDLPW